MTTYDLDEACVTVLVNYMNKENIKFSYENNVLYATDSGNGFKIDVSKYGYVVSKINELKNFRDNKSNDKLVLQYLYEKIKKLDDKITDLELENETLKEKINEL